MDNLSHSLAGMAAAELLHRSLAPEPDAQAQKLRRRMLLVAGGVACNLPDLDLLLTGLLAAPLGYLLHHRGHTHTLLYAAPQALLLIALIWLLWPAARRLLHASVRARTALVAATVIGLLLHFALDYFNSYGLHPFHPFDSRWLYGDMVFILEPVFWVGFGVPLILMVPARWLRYAFVALIAAVLVWTTLQGFLHWGSLLALAFCAIGIGAVQQRAGHVGRAALVTGMLVAAGFVALQGWASQAGRALVAAHLEGVGPASRLLDTAMTPYPANPLCWSFISVERNDSARSYRVRRGMLSVAPALMPLQACPTAFAQDLAAPSASIGLSWESEISLARLRSMAANCHFRAWMRFARAPVLVGEVASDARFSNGRGANFSDFKAAAFENVPCSASVPGWDLPRQDLLDAVQ